MKCLNRLLLKSRPGHRRKGFTLLEVLISAMVISIGMLGVASMIPMGRVMMARAVNADMASACGRAGLRMIATQGALKNSPPQYINWNGGTGQGSRLFDGKNAFDYDCSADIQAEEPAGAKYPTYRTDLTKTNYEWVGTVRSLGNNYYEVSAAVCYRRPLSGFSASGTFNGGIGGGSISTGADIDVEPGHWVYVTGSGHGYWYKVVAVLPVAKDMQLLVSGPDWKWPNSVTIASPGKVVGVYTEVMSANRR